MSTRDIMSTIGSALRRIERLERFQKPKISGGGSGAPATGTYITVDDESAILPNSRQADDGADIIITDGGASGTLLIARSGNKVLRYDAGNDVLVEYAKSGAGIASALAAAAVGDAVVLPPGTFTGDLTVPAGVMLIGTGYLHTTIAGKVTLSDGSCIALLKIYTSESSTDTIRALTGPSSGTAYTVMIWAYCNNTGSGRGYALRLMGGDLVDNSSRFSGETTGDVEE